MRGRVLDGDATTSAADDAPASAGRASSARCRSKATASCVLPARIVARDSDGRAWSHDDRRRRDPARAARHPRPPGPVLACAGGPSPSAWRAMVAQTLAAIDRGEVEKVVLARDVDVDADAPFDIAEVLDILRATQPGCTVYAVDGFVGASPELLVRRHGDRRSCPVRWRAPGSIPAALLASRKDAHEHRVVVDAIAGALRRCAPTSRVDGPRRGALRRRHPPRHDDHAVASPTATSPRSTSSLACTRRPAVGGWPAEPARRMIGELEGRAARPLRRPVRVGRRARRRRVRRRAALRGDRRRARTLLRGRRHRRRFRTRGRVGRDAGQARSRCCSALVRP